MSRFIDLDSAIADAIRRDFRAMAAAIAQNDLNQLDARMVIDCTLAQSGTRGGDERLYEAMTREDAV
jgi:hypothetical protein